jgi:hypothetical protein
MVAVKFHNIAGMPGKLDRFPVPAGVDDSQAGALQGERKAGEEIRDLPAGLVVVQHPLRNDGSFEEKFPAVEPVVVIFLVAEQEIQVVIAKDALRQAVLDEPLNEGDHGGAVWPTVGEIAHEDEPPPFGVNAVFSIAEAGEQIVEGLDLAMGVSDDIDRAFKQGTDEGHGGVPGGANSSRGKIDGDDPHLIGVSQVAAMTKSMLK